MTLTRRRFARHGLMMTAAAALLAAAPAFAQAPSGKLVLYTSQPEKDATQTVAAFKKAYGVFTERGYRSRLLSAAYRNGLQWTEFVGGDVVLSPPFAWQQRFEGSGVNPEPRMDIPVDPQIVETLYAQMPEFRKAYDVDGMTPAEFDEFGATRKTLRQFLQADADLDALVREVLVPAP